MEFLVISQRFHTGIPGKSAYDVVAILNEVNSMFVISYTLIFVECVSVLLVTQYCQCNFSNLGDNSQWYYFLRIFY